MSFFTILIVEKPKLETTKKELFKTRQRSLCFIEDSAILTYTKTFQDQKKFTAVTIEGYFSSFDFPKDYQDKSYGNNRSYLESCFTHLAQNQKIAFGYFFDDRGWQDFEEQLIIKLPSVYQESHLYLLQPN